MANKVLQCEVAIVGGGTAGLALSTELKRLGVSDIVVLEREKTAGGVPRHCGHYGFGIRELKKVLKGPDYARTLVNRAEKAGVDIRTEVTVTKIHPNALLSLSTPDGEVDLQAQRVVLCTGVRESSRAQRFIGGQRPLGVVATGALQSMVYLHGQRPFVRPVILGTELVSFSAIMTCEHMGIRPIAMLEENSRISVRKFMRPYPALKNVPLKTDVRDLQILGDSRVEAVRYFDAQDSLQTIETDGLIISGKFRPEAALLHGSHIEIDPGTGGPSIDQFGRTTDPSYFGTGNLLRPAETSSWCWHEAVRQAKIIAQDLADPIGDTPFASLRSSDPAIRFVLPQRLALSDKPGGMEKMQIALSSPIKGQIRAQSSGEILARKFLRSRPLRRILMPLAPIINASPTSTVDISTTQ